MAAKVSTSSVETMENEMSSSSEGKFDKCSESSPSQKASVSLDSKVCGVCGDKALGNNFNAITCESCKAFFRRNALRTKEFVCPFNNNCKVDAITRRFCQRCRLKKCFDIGMKKEWIMTDEEKKIKKQKIEQNRKKRTSLENSGAADDAFPQDEEEDESLESPPTGLKTRLSPETQRIIPRRTLTAISELTPTGATNVDGNNVDTQPSSEGIGGANLDDSTNSADAPKFHKQPMGLHNQNQRSCDSNQFPSSRKNVKEKNCITIHVKRPPSPSYTSYPAATPNQQPHLRNFEANPNPDDCPKSPPRPTVDQLENLHHLHPQSFPESAVHPTSSSLAPGDSSNSSFSPPPSKCHPHSQSHPRPSPPPPLMKYPPHKRARMFEQMFEDRAQPHLPSDNQPTPLLSSLIKPGNPESSPDCTLSPPAPLTMPSADNHSNWDDAESPSQKESSTFYTSPDSFEKSGNTSPSTAIHHHHHQLEHLHYSQKDYPDEYDRSSPPPQSPSLRVPTHPNGYYHHHYSSTQSYRSVDSDNASHHCSPYQECRKPHDESQDASVRLLSLNTMDSILSIAIAAEFNSFGMLGGNIPNSKELNKAEQAKLNELLLASQALHAPVDAERPIPKESDSSDPSLLNVINLTEIAIRRLIKMSKKISGFKNMCQEDQIALLKGGCTEMMILRSAVTYDPDRDSWQIPHSNPGYNINLGVLKEARGNLYEEHQRFNKTFRSEWRKDENIMIILCAITLFTPERHNVIHKDVVKLEQDSYYYLLKRYLESILNGCEAKSNYLQLIRKIAELRALNSSHVRVFLEMNPKEVEPLLIEIFDLK